MLQTKSVQPKLLELLNSLMKINEFKDFILVGGTSLALQLGHRVSVDIDLFGKCEIDESLFIEILEEFGKVTILKKSKNILICAVDGIKVDFVNYKYPLIEEYLIIDSIRLASKKDIAAMKLNAIAGRGSKKDFIDLHYLLKEFTIEQIMGFYLQKYSDGSEFMVRKSLTYFEDADLEETPILFEEIEWENIKTQLIGLM
jgi:hypothetical protein